GLAGLASSADGQPDKKPVQDEKKPAKAEPGYLEIRLPPNASLAFDNYQTRQRGPIRYYMTPPLIPGYKYTYELTAAWPGPDGKPQKESKKVNVNPGETTKVQFGPPDKPKPKDKEKPKDTETTKEKPKDNGKPKPKDKDKGASAGWIKLFNGKDLT